MNFQIDTTKISSHEALDHALIQCLRVFAKHGRKLRTQQLMAYEHVSSSGLVIKDVMDCNHKENNQIELIHA